RAQLLAKLRKCQPQITRHILTLIATIRRQQQMFKTQTNSRTQPETGADRTVIARETVARRVERAVRVEPISRTQPRARSTIGASIRGTGKIPIRRHSPTRSASKPVQITTRQGKHSVIVHRIRLLRITPGTAPHSLGGSAHTLHRSSTHQGLLKRGVIRRTHRIRHRRQIRLVRTRRTVKGITIRSIRVKTKIGGHRVIGPEQGFIRRNRCRRGLQIRLITVLAEGIRIRHTRHRTLSQSPVPAGHRRTTIGARAPLLAEHDPTRIGPTVLRYPGCLVILIHHRKRTRAQRAEIPIRPQINRSGRGPFHRHHHLGHKHEQDQTECDEGR
ncbi:hypothetical protein BPSY_0075, partial [Bifidobacterium psychraerophilum]